LLYKSLVDGQVDASQADGTAGEIAGYNLVLLEDPKGYGGPYNIAPVVRDDVLAAYPKIADTLNAASVKITNEEMSKLNWEVAGKGSDPHDVAKQWLNEHGLLNK
jgi:glycine betaine/choline ABC-type transport system substrate-binding protein